MALEQRDGHINAVHRRDQLASLLHCPETPGQNPDHPNALVHAAIDFDPPPPGSSIRLRLASRPVFFAFVLSRCTWLHSAADGYTTVALVGDSQRCWCCVWSVDDEVCKVRFCFSSVRACLTTDVSADMVRYCGSGLRFGCSESD
jgi:hypothetical protein